MFVVLGVKEEEEELTGVTRAIEEEITFGVLGSREEEEVVVPVPVVLRVAVEDVVEVRDVLVNGWRVLEERRRENS
jgi:hypothetical protein